MSSSRPSGPRRLPCPAATDRRRRAPVRIPRRRYAASGNPRASPGRLACLLCVRPGGRRPGDRVFAAGNRAPGSRTRRWSRPGSSAGTGPRRAHWARRHSPPGRRPFRVCAETRTRPSGRPGPCGSGRASSRRPVASSIRPTPSPRLRSPSSRPARPGARAHCQRRAPPSFLPATRRRRMRPGSRTPASGVVPAAWS